MTSHVNLLTGTNAALTHQGRTTHAYKKIKLKISLAKGGHFVLASMCLLHSNLVGRRLCGGNIAFISFKNGCGRMSNLSQNRCRVDMVNYFGTFRDSTPLQMDY